MSRPRARTLDDSLGTAAPRTIASGARAKSARMRGELGSRRPDELSARALRPLHDRPHSAWVRVLSRLTKSPARSVFLVKLPKSLDSSKRLEFGVTIQ